MEKIYREDYDKIVAKYNNLTTVEVFQWCKFRNSYMALIDKKCDYMNKKLELQIIMYYVPFDNLIDLDIKLQRLSTKRRGKGRKYSDEFIDMVLKEKSNGLTYKEINQKHNICIDIISYICKNYKLGR